jgi:DNA-binding NtrC family response regulator
MPFGEVLTNPPSEQQIESPSAERPPDPGRSSMKRRILVADDKETSVEGLHSLLSSWGYEVEQAGDGEEALAKALIFRPDVVIADLVMPKRDGLALLKALSTELPASTIIIVTAHGTIETAVSAMRQGAYDYLTKPLDIRRLKVVLEKAIEKTAVLREVTLLRRQLKETRGFGGLIGTSKPMQEIFHLIELAAPTNAPVLICGESGTGKELVGRMIHEMSPRRHEAFVGVNCSAIPDTLLESELFGHEKGAFTGALNRRPGYFELADRGTLFLDEITEMSPSLQAKYLRIIQEGAVRRLGGQTELKVDVRIVAATNKDPHQTIKEGRFREDLFYRLNVFNISIPPVRDRKRDIPLLIEAFLEEFNARYGKAITSADEAATRMLLQHSWPGNVRELRNTIERAVVTCKDTVITPECLPFQPLVSDQTGAPSAIVVSVGTTIEEAERALILRTLESVDNNKTRAADILGVSAKTLHNKLHRYRAERDAEVGKADEPA